MTLNVINPLIHCEKCHFNELHSLTLINN